MTDKPTEHDFDKAEHITTQSRLHLIQILDRYDGFAILTQYPSEHDVFYKDIEDLRCIVRVAMKETLALTTKIIQRRVNLGL